MKGKEPWYIKTRNTIVDAGNLVCALWLSNVFGNNQLGKDIIFEVNGYMTAGNKFGGKLGVVGGSIDLGSVEFAKGKIDIVNPTKSAWGEKYNPYQASIGAGIDVGLGKNSGLSLGIGYEESWDYTQSENSNRFMRRPEDESDIKSSIVLGVSTKNKNESNPFVTKEQGTVKNTVYSNTPSREEHAIEIGWMVALFWSFGVNIKIGYKTEVKK